MSTTPHADPLYKEFDVVRTVEGIEGTITNDPEWSPEDEEWMYFVEWEDGAADTQPESFFATDGLV